MYTHLENGVSAGILHTPRGNNPPMNRFFRGSFTAMLVLTNVGARGRPRQKGAPRGKERKDEPRQTAIDIEKMNGRTTHRTNNT